MADTDEVNEVKKPVKEKIEYDGCYRIDSTTRDGKTVHIYCRGYKLKSWLNFEKSMDSIISTEYHQVTETEYMDHHWTAYPYDMDEDEETVTVLIKQPVEKPLVVQKVTKNRIKTTKVSKTDRNIGDLSAFLSETEPKPKKSRRTKVVK
jgi:hypothetical protein